MFLFRYLTHERKRKRLRRSGTHVKTTQKIKKNTQKRLKTHDKHEYLRKYMLQTRKNVNAPTLNMHNSKTTHMFSKQKNRSFSHD